MGVVSVPSAREGVLCLQYLGLSAVASGLGAGQSVVVDRFANGESSAYAKDSGGR